MLSWQPFLVRSRLKTRINAAQCRHHNRYHNILKVLSESIVPKLYQNDSKRTKTCSLEICGMLFAALRHCSSLFIRRWMRQRLKAALTMVHTCLLHVLVLISLQVAEQFQLRNFAARVKLWQRFGWSDTATEKELPFFFSAGAPFTRRDRTCSYGPFGIWMHSCTSRKFTLLRKVGLGSVSQGFEMFLTQFP